MVGTGADDPAVTFSDSVQNLRDVWEQTSFKLETRQCDVSCVEQEQLALSTAYSPPYKLSFDPDLALRSDDRGWCVFESRFDRRILLTADSFYSADGPKPKVAVIREEGSNGDREMSAAFMMAGFEVYDITMTDLLRGNVSLDEFSGVAFVGGFSYADVLGSAKGKGDVSCHGQSLSAS